MLASFSPLLPFLPCLYLLNLHLANSPVTLTLDSNLISSSSQWRALFTDGNEYTMLLLPITWLLYRTIRPFLRNKSLIVGKAVIVTGSDTGFGRAISLKLASDGVVVYAGVLTAASGKKLLTDSGKNNNLIPVVMNVCSDKDVDKCLRTVEKGGYDLVGLVNNAGISAFGFCELLPMSR